MQESPCAYFIGSQYKSTFLAEFTGYDPEFAKYSPGMLMLLPSIRESFDLTPGPTQFDLRSGNYSYKRVVCNAGWQEGAAYLYAPMGRGLMLNFQMTAISLLNAGLRKLIARREFLKKVMKQWQRHALRNSTQKDRGPVAQCV